MGMGIVYHVLMESMNAIHVFVLTDMPKIQTTPAHCVQKGIFLTQKENVFVVPERPNLAVATGYVHFQTKPGVIRKQQYAVVMDLGSGKTVPNVYYAMGMVDVGIHLVANHAIAIHYGLESIVRGVSKITTRSVDCAQRVSRTVQLL